MYPYLKDGDYVLRKKNFVLEVGKVFTFEHDVGGETIILVKRLTEIIYSPTNGQQLLFFVGDNLAFSTDSRDFGFVRPTNVTGEVVKIKDLFGGN